MIIIRVKFLIWVDPNFANDRGKILQPITSLFQERKKEVHHNHPVWKKIGDCLHHFPRNRWQLGSGRIVSTRIRSATLLTILKTLMKIYQERLVCGRTWLYYIQADSSQSVLGRGVQLTNRNEC